MQDVLWLQRESVLGGRSSASLPEGGETVGGWQNQRRGR